MALPNYTADRSAPITAQQGDLWFNTSNNQLNVHNGGGFVPITAPTIGAAANASSLANPEYLPIPTVTGSFGASYNLPAGQAGLLYDPVNSRMWMVASGGVFKSAAFA